MTNRWTMGCGALVGCAVLAALGYYYHYPYKNMAGLAAAQRMCRENQIVHVVNPQLWQRIRSASDAERRGNPEEYDLEYEFVGREEVPRAERAKVLIYHATNRGRVVLLIRDPYAVSRWIATDLRMASDLASYMCFSSTPSEARRILLEH